MLLSRVITIAIFGLTAAGCAQWTKVREAPPTPPPAVAPPGGTGRAAVIDSVAVTVNGTSSPASQDFVQHVASRLRETGVFTIVFDPANAHQAPSDSVRIHLDVSENVDANMGGNMTKGFFIGLTLFLLTPALPLRVDKDSRMACTVTVPGRGNATKTVFTDASAYFMLFANSYVAGQKLDLVVTDRNVTAIVSWICGQALSGAPQHTSFRESRRARADEPTDRCPEITALLQGLQGRHVARFGLS